ncbi:MAG: YHS domain-containing protein [Pseudomonadota bacterium]|nr:YHS domain-containing protein [Nevskiales bacterium]MEC9363548.1 YHS domain-containing protein [Pseudomonadota bacterium]
MGGHHGGSRDWRGAPPSDHGGTAHVEAPHAQATAALDPVSGNPVRTDRALTAVYGGRAYYFESEETRKRFEAEPQKYASHEPPPGERPRRRGGC